MEFCGPVVVQRHAHLSHIDLFMGQKLVKHGNSEDQILQSAYLINRWVDFLCSKFYEIVSTCSCETLCNFPFFFKML